MKHSSLIDLITETVRDELLSLPKTFNDQLEETKTPLDRI